VGARVCAEVCGCLRVCVFCSVIGSVWVLVVVVCGGWLWLALGVGSG